jgi:polyvinyl alcohol dehydrogenase (cytochrome)
VWGSNPVVDEARGTVFVGTGNNYSHPTDPTYLSCIANGGTEAACLSPYDHADSVLALDMNTGAIKWATRLMNWDQPYVAGSDDWNTSCFIPQFTNCPPALPTIANPNQPTGPDFDFGSAPNEITYQTSNGPKTIIGAGQKSGVYYALDPDTGTVLWPNAGGPGVFSGGYRVGIGDGRQAHLCGDCQSFWYPLCSRERGFLGRA